MPDLLLVFPFVTHKFKFSNNHPPTALTLEHSSFYYNFGSNNDPLPSLVLVGNKIDVIEQPTDASDGNKLTAFLFLRMFAIVTCFRKLNFQIKSN